jgi:molybdopterin-guanine dinucleotide biosynthesis protein A
MNGVTGYVLAGGRSSRMGQDKALLELCGRPLVERAIEKLQRVADRVCIVGSRPELGRYAEVVPDIREGCGPLAGAEAAVTDARTNWSLLMAVDMPFVPSGLLRWMIEGVLARVNVRIAMFSTDGLPQPTMTLLHKDIAPAIGEALGREERRLFPVLREVASDLAGRRELATEDLLWMPDIEESIRGYVSPKQWQEREHWFANLNTQEDFAAALGRAALLLEE